ncbi:MAG: chorismate synthase [Deltaproteobacteria bacterium]|nr:chorismate synthase [Deltaproteobacteria bacterium]
MNRFGEQFRVTILGESHGDGVGIIIDGCPAGLPLDVPDFHGDLERRRGGRVKGTTPRKEDDIPQLLTGYFQGKSTGAPLTIFFANSDVKAADYAQRRFTPRPGHADFVAHEKFGGFHDYRGGGHFSGRLTAAVVAAGVVAKKLLAPSTVNAQLLSVGGSTNVDETVSTAMQDGDSVGGLVECVVDGLPVGLGEPFFDSIESVLSHGLFAIPAIKGVEFGLGFASAQKRGSEVNDAVLRRDGRTKTNHAGGVNGGITNGNPLVFRVAVKPTASIRQQQETVDLRSGEPATLAIQGRHDACIALRVPVVVEAVAAIVLVDFMCREKRIPRVLGRNV